MEKLVIDNQKSYQIKLIIGKKNRTVIKKGSDVKAFISTINGQYEKVEVSEIEIVEPEKIKENIELKQKKEKINNN